GRRRDAPARGSMRLQPTLDAGKPSFEAAPDLRHGIMQLPNRISLRSRINLPGVAKHGLDVVRQLKDALRGSVERLERISAFASCRRARLVQRRVEGQLMREDFALGRCADTGFCQRFPSRVLALAERIRQAFR